MSGKKLLILERSQSDLLRNVSDDGTITLEGVFTEFGVKNKNNRIYEEKEVMPHINELQEKVKVGKLLGELDHPKDFDISLSNVSHVIESLNYDSEKKQVIGRIRLLNTSKGKEAQSLIKDGIPLHISSRAAGTVGEDGKVKIKKFFTYDLVADPGFENAELARVNESYGFENDSNLLIYEMDEKEEIEKINDKKESMMENSNNYVTVEDFQKYTEYVKSVLNGVKESAKPVSDNTEIVEKLIQYSEQIAEKVNQVGDYVNYISENLDKSISFSDYLAENVNQIKSYTTYLAEELDSTIQYTEHVAEKADQGIQYTEEIAEKLDQGIQYTEHVAEKLDKGIQYTEHVAEKTNQSIKYAEHIAEKVDETIKYSNYLGENIETGIGYAEYVAEKVDQNIAYSEHVAENLDKSIRYAEYLAESISSEEESEINESIVPAEKTEYVKSYTESIEEKLDALIVAAKTKAVSEMHFMNFLTEAKKNEFKSLSEDKQKLIVESMNATPIMSTGQAENVWESAFIEKKRALNFVDDMPEKYQAKWAALSEGRQNQIIAESKFHNLTTPYSINNFWATRDLRPSQFELEKLTESKTAAEQTEVSKKAPLINESFAADLISRVKFNLGRS
jgi:methyl-accepting chemotaxis protein